jgi:hypothetical protein
MDKGTLTIKDLTVGSTGRNSVTGALNITDAAAQVSVGGNFIINERGQFNAAPGVTINMTGANFYDYKPNDDLSNLGLLFSNTEASDTLRFIGRLILGTLEVRGRLTLDDPPDKVALYVSNLILGDGSFLDLAGISLYFQTETLGNNVTFLDGTPQQGAVPLPASAWLFLTGLLGLGFLERRKRKGTS